ncbi:hypothetical protein GF337_00360 [candidate division KSB1 bacterium]|nr:hypothetical protein [candidate division KSB1 bacterium]
MSIENIIINIHKHENACKKGRRMKFTSLFLITVLLILYACSVSSAQEYIIGPEDELAVTFWQEPNLNSTVRVSQNGTIVLPVIGSLTAAGLTPTELAEKIARKMSLFNKRVSQASVVVNQYGSKKVYVTGHVLQPGKYAFEVVPDLWKIILEAGGPAETAILSKVKVIRGGTGSGNTITVDLSRYLSEGDETGLPDIYPGDTINIPGISAETGTGETSIAGGLTTMQPSADAFYIYGQVASPGGYPLTKRLNVLEAIILAGGPTPSAKMEEVKVIIKGKSFSSVVTLNLEKYSKNGLPAPIEIKSGDTIYIPQRKESLFTALTRRGIFYDILRITITATTSMLIWSLAR